jgi:DMSO/TMAO reductase YedYZ molybdopterin-dependent catalytic subunit
MQMNRRTLIAGAGLGVAGGAIAAANGMVDLHLPGGPSERPLTPRFPQKGEMIVQRVRPPLLETPFEVFDQGVITPNDRHFVRWHYSDIPTSIDVASYRVAVHGAVKAPQSLSLGEILKAGEHIEFAAVNQCAGNGRGLFEPRVAGAQWANGAMSNAKWRGVRLRDVLDKAGVGGDAKFVRFKGLDKPLVEGAPHFAKSIPIEVARRDDTILAFAMNGEALPLLNGFPLRLVVPGWFSTYWVKMLSDIEVLTAEDDNFWMAKAYRMPTVPVKPGDKDFPTVPVTTMGPRSFVTSHADETTTPRATTTQIQSGQSAFVDLQGIAFGGDCGVGKVEVQTYHRGSPSGVAGPIVPWRNASVAKLAPAEGGLGFRRWTCRIAVMSWDVIIDVRCTNANGVIQPDAPAWNPSGYARNGVERITLRVS